MELLILNIFFFIYIMIIRRKTRNEITDTTIKFTTTYKKLVDLQNNNVLISETFNKEAKNKVYELGLILLNIKAHYEQQLEMSDEYFDSELREELQKSIKAVENQLREIGFINNKKKACESIMKSLYFIDESDFSKN